MGRSNDIKDMAVDKPLVYDSGFSDLYPVFTKDGLHEIAQYTKDGRWLARGGEEICQVKWWLDHEPWPDGFKADYSQYGGEA